MTLVYWADELSNQIRHCNLVYRDIPAKPLVFFPVCCSWAVNITVVSSAQLYAAELTTQAANSYLTCRSMPLICLIVWAWVWPLWKHLSLDLFVRFIQVRSWTLSSTFSQLVAHFKVQLCLMFARKTKASQSLSSKSALNLIFLLSCL